MSGSEPSQADRDLAAKASQPDLDVTPRQVERWRQGGYLLPSARRGLGRGQGSVATYSSEAVTHARDLAKALRDHRSLDVAGLVVFLKGHSVKERALKRAYRANFQSIRDFLRVTEDSDPWDIANRVSKAGSRRSALSPLLKSWRARLQAKKKGTQLAPALHDMIRFLLGGFDEDEYLSPEVFEVMGYQELVEDLDPEDQANLHSAIREVNLPAFEKAVEEASLAQLTRARDLLVDILGVFKLSPATEGLPPQSEFTMAVIGIPSTLVLGPFLGAALAAGIEKLRVGTALP
jgi:hypothetical protein